MYDTVFIGYNVFAAAVREVRMAIIDKVKIVSNKGDANRAYYSFIQAHRLRSSGCIP